MGVLEVSGKQRGGRVYVGLGGHLVDRMDVARWHAQGETGYAAPGALDGSCVGAAARQDLHLVRNAVRLRDIAEVAHELRIAQQRRVHDLDGRALA